MPTNSPELISWLRIGLSVLFWLFFFPALALPQGLEKALITHSSESISIAPLIYGIERGFYRREGVDLEFRILRNDLAIAAIVSTREVDYMYGVGSGFTGAVRGLPLKVVAYTLKDILFYFLSQPAIQSFKDLKGKKVAVGLPSDTGGLAAKATLRAFGLDPDKDVVYIAVGAASVRFAAMEARSVEAAIMPVPWNIRMRQKGFRELAFAGNYLRQPLSGIVTSAEKIEKNPQQVKKILRGFLRSLRAFRQERRDVTEFIARRFSLDSQVAEESYNIVLQTLSEDGTVSEKVLEDYLEQVKKETGAKKPIGLSDIVDYRLLREAAKELESKG